MEETVKKIILTATAVSVGLIILASIILYLLLIVIEVDPPTLKDSTATLEEQEVKAIEINNYKELMLARQNQHTNIFDFVIIRTLLPLFTSMIAAFIAYVFAEKGLQMYKEYLIEKRSRL